MTFIEFEDYVFPIEEILRAERYYFIRKEEDGTEKQLSRLKFKNGDFFSFPEEKYDIIKEILLNYNTKSPKND